MLRTSTKLQSGFTLVEVAVIAPIIVLVLGGILALLVGLMSDNIASRAELEIINDTSNALHVMEDDMKLASAYLTTKGSAFTDPYGSNGSGGAWSYKGTSATSRVLLMQTYATNRSPRDSQKTPVYINENGCNAGAILANTALNANTIYFVSGGNLYRRTLTDTSKTTCTTQFQRQSCPPDLASPNAICKTDDSLLLSNVSSFSIDYYDTATATTPIDAYNSSSSTILDNAVAAKVNLTISKVLGGKTFTFTRTLTTAKLN